MVKLKGFGLKVLLLFTAGFSSALLASDMSSGGILCMSRAPRPVAAEDDAVDRLAEYRAPFAPDVLAEVRFALPTIEGMLVFQAEGPSGIRLIDFANPDVLTAFIGLVMGYEPLRQNLQANKTRFFVRVFKVPEMHIAFIATEVQKLFGWDKTQVLRYLKLDLLGA